MTTNIDNRTKIKVDLGFEENALLPVTSYYKRISHAQCDVPHAHPRAQLIYGNRGIIKVVTPNQIWLVNPSQGVWIAENNRHQVFFPDEVEINSLFIDGTQTSLLPKKSFAFDMGPFLKSLILKVASFGNPAELAAQQLRIVQVLLDEIAEIEPSATYLPTSEDERIKKVTAAMMEDIAGNRSVGHYAALCCVSPRTLSRLFLKELGMNFSEWRTRMKMLEAMKRLGEKQPVKEIAFDLGYENVSSFIYAFRNYFGRSPGSYFSG